MVYLTKVQLELGSTRYGCSMNDRVSNRANRKHLNVGG